MPVIDVTMVEGRSIEMKDAFVTALTDAAVNALSAPRESVRVILREVPATNFAAGGETIAQRRVRTAGGTCPGVAAGRFRVEVDGVGSIRCNPDESLLQAMERAGEGVIAVGCRGGGCGVCRVQVMTGRYLTRPMSAARVSPSERVSGYALACRLFPRGDLSVRSAVPASLLDRLREADARRSLVGRLRRPGANAPDSE